MGAAAMEHPFQTTWAFRPSCIPAMIQNALRMQPLLEIRDVLLQRPWRSSNKVRASQAPGYPFCLSAVMAVARHISLITQLAISFISACTRRLILCSDNVITRLVVVLKGFCESSNYHDSKCVWHACAGAGAYSTWKFRLLLASALLSAVAVITLGLLAAQPWWQYAPGAVPLLAVVQGVACVAAALLFVVGMAGYGSVYHALTQTASDLDHLRMTFQMRDRA